MKNLMKFAFALFALAAVMVSCSDDDENNVQIDSASQIAGAYTGTWTKTVNITMADGSTSEESATLSGKLTFVKKDNDNKVATMTAYAADNTGAEEINSTINVNVLTYSGGVSWFNDYKKNGFTVVDNSALAGTDYENGMKIGGVMATDNTITGEFSYEVQKKVGKKKNKYSYTYKFNGAKAQ